MKKFRIQLTQNEVWWIRNAIVSEYHRERSNIRWEKYRIVKGIDQDSRAYPIKEREEHLKQLGRLLKKLSRYHTEKWFIR